MSDPSTSKPTLNLGVGLTDDHSSNKLTGAKIILLTAPDSDSNYSDWEYQMLTLLENYNVDYVLKTIKPEARPANWERDNKAVCTLISQVVEPANFRYTKPNRKDAAKTWEALRTAHHDNSAGGRMYWLRKISTSKMESNDLLGHIDEVAKMAERLDSLITPDKPLTVDEIHATALINSVPDDWVSCMSSLLNKRSVSAEEVVQSLKGELLRRKTHSEDDPISVSSAKPKPSNSKAGKNKTKSNHPPRDTPRHCDFCNVDGHDLNNCNNTRRILDKVKANQKYRTGPNDQERRQTKPAAWAGRTSAVTLGQSSKAYAEEEESDYSGSELEVTAGNAVASLSASLNLSGSGDANIDSGCSMSMTPDISEVDQPKTDCTPVRLADHSVIEASHKGLAKLPLSGDLSVKTLVVPTLHEPLLSVAAMCDEGVTVVFTKASCDFFASSSSRITGDLLGRGYRRGNLYYLPSTPVSSNSSTHLISEPPENSLLAYHLRFSHIGLKPLKLLLKTHHITPSVMNEIDVQRCPTCVQSKMPRKAFKSRSAHRSSSPGQLIHSDVGSYEVLSREGYKYFITFVDDCSKFLTVYPMKSKSDSFACFKVFRAFFEKSGAHKILALRTDNGGEYISNEFLSYLSQAGIKHEPGPPHSPELNGVAERTNRTISNIVRSSLLSAHLPKSFWTDAL
jgi:transposase InsO family protein